MLFGGAGVPSAAPLVAEVLRRVYGDVDLMERTLRSAMGKQQERVRTKLRFSFESAKVSAQ